MMSRRRALLIGAMANSAPKPYNVKIIGSLLMHQATSPTAFSSWYAGYFYTVDTQNNLFILDNYTRYLFDYSHPSVFSNQILERYCILDSERGNTMYYFPADCTAEYKYDQVTGLYTVTAYGKIQMFTPLAS